MNCLSPTISWQPKRVVVDIVGSSGGRVGGVEREDLILKRTRLGLIHEGSPCRR